MLEYSELMDKKNKFLKQYSGIAIEEYKTRLEQEKVLDHIFGNSWNRKEKIVFMNIEQGFDIIGNKPDVKFLTYETIGKTNTINMVIFKNDKKLFKVEYSVGKDNGYIYYENKCTAYMMDTSRIESKFIEKTIPEEMLPDGVYGTNITVMNFKRGIYSRHHYRLYSLDNNIVSFVNHNEIHLNSEPGFNQRLDIIKGNIDYAKETLNNRLLGILNGEDVKVYHINRKK